MEEYYLRNSKRSELVLALPDRAQMHIANRTTCVAPELDMDKRRARIREGDSLSLESRESRDGLPFH